jgi:hypothetical protein
MYNSVIPRDAESLLLDEHSRYLIKINERLTKLVRMRQEVLAVEGTTYGNRLTLTAGSPVTQLDFVESRHINVPIIANLDLPQVPAAKLTIYNEGTGVLLFDTNRGEGHLTANTYLGAGEATEINLAKRGIKRLNLVAQGNNLTVRINIVI